MKRDDPRDIGIRNLEVHLDGAFADDLLYKARFERALPAGTHVLRATNRASKTDLEVEIRPGETTTVRVANVAGVIGRLMMGALGAGFYRAEAAVVPTEGG